MLTRRYNRFGGRSARAFFLPHDVRASRDATPSTHIAPGVSNREMHRGLCASCAKLGHALDHDVSLFPAKCPSRPANSDRGPRRKAHASRSIPAPAIRFDPERANPTDSTRWKRRLTIFAKPYPVTPDRIQMQNFCHAARNARRDTPIVADAMQQLSHE